MNLPSKVSDAVKKLNPQLYDITSTPIIPNPTPGPTKADITSHKQLQRLAELEISRRGVRQQLHLSDMTRKKKVGWPDSTFVLNGIPVAIEYKIRPDKLSEEQAKVLEDMRLDGWRVFVCYSFDEVVLALKEVVVKTKEDGS